MTRKRPERRSLSGLLGEAQTLTQAAESTTLSLSLEQLHRYEGQPRRSFPEEELHALAQSIRERGVLQPLLVRPDPAGGYQIAAGERRFRAAQLAGLSEVPVLIRHFSDLEMLEVGLIENIQREGLNVLDEVEGKLRLVGLLLGLSPDEARGRLMTYLRQPEEEEVGRLTELFAMLGRESWQSFAKNKLRVLGWPSEVLDLLRSGQLSYGQAAVIAAAPTEQRPDLLAAAQAGASVQALRQKQQEGMQAATTSVSHWEAEAQGVRQFLGQKRQLQQLDATQQQELQAWLHARPAWLKG